MIESDLSTCRRCGAIKLRKLVGTFDGKNKKYIDEHGKLWNGRQCPDCKCHISKLQIKERRAKSNSNKQD